MNTELIIIGAGASGLMAAAAACEQNIRTVVLERRHKPGRKLLLCGNNRCNLTSNLSLSQMLEAYAPPVNNFLNPALKHFTPHDLQHWFKQHGLKLRIEEDRRVYPASEKADDVLHVFTDILREKGVPIIYNCPVHEVRKAGKEWEAVTENLKLQSRNVLIATGGVSYPKTGSVGDGQKIAKKLGHKVTPFKPGLVGFEIKDRWVTNFADDLIPKVEVTINSRGKAEGTTHGVLVFTRYGIRGSAVSDASRIIARKNLTNIQLTVDMLPQMNRKRLDEYLKNSSSKTLQQVLGKWIPSSSFCKAFLQQVLNLDGRMRLGSVDGEAMAKLKRNLKAWTIEVVKPRPLKEAMVTVGGVALNSLQAETLQSKNCRGLYFAGEVIDVDGPTGGFNLQAAFSTARLAVHSMGKGSRR